MSTAAEDDFTEPLEPVFEDEGGDRASWSLDDVIAMAKAPGYRDVVLRALGGKHEVTMGQVMPSAEDVLSHDQLSLFQRMVEHRLPGRRGTVLAEVVALHDRALAKRIYDEASRPKDTGVRMVDGGTFLLDLPDTPPALWGHRGQVVWADGEALLLTGTPGVGKTTLAAQVVRGRVAGGDVLGLPVQPTEGRVLYLAMDRPQQIARALHRTLGDLERSLLNDRLRFWAGPPPNDVAAHPEALLKLAQQAGADTVVVDSLKDAAVGLSADEVGAGYNRARQLALANGVQVVELHHMVKRNADGKAPTALEDVYGSVWLTAGAGSVVLLAGRAGDPVVSWQHLKQPAEEVGPFWVQHDHIEGLSTIHDTNDAADLVEQAGPDGITAKEAAVVLFNTRKPTPGDVEKARRRLDAEVRAERMIRKDGDRGTRTPTVWISATGSEFRSDGDDDLL